MSRIALLAVVLVAAAAAAGTATGGTAALKSCSYTGPAWKVNTVTGKVWILDFQNTTCAFGKTWAKKLALLKTPKAYGAKLAGGPKGWRCQALGTGQKTVLSGSCVKGTKFFQWHPAT